MKELILGILMLSSLSLLGQKKINILKNVHTAISIEAESWIYYVNKEATFCFSKKEVLNEHANKIRAFKSHVDSLSNPPKWYERRLEQLKSMESYLLQNKTVLIVDPMLNIDQFNILDPSPYEFTALHIVELMCPILEKGNVEITILGEYINSYQKAFVTEFDEYSETQSIQYIIAKDSTVLLKCPPVIHADFESEEK